MQNGCYPFLLLQLLLLQLFKLGTHKNIYFSLVWMGLRETSHSLQNRQINIFLLQRMFWKSVNFTICHLLGCLYPLAHGIICIAIAFLFYFVLSFLNSVFKSKQLFSIKLVLLKKLLSVLNWQYFLGLYFNIRVLKTHFQRL